MEEADSEEADSGEAEEEVESCLEGGSVDKGGSIGRGIGGKIASVCVCSRETCSRIERRRVPTCCWTRCRSAADP